MTTVTSQHASVSPKPEWPGPVPEPPPVLPYRQPRCWLCGRFVHRPKYVFTRECPRCNVRWIEPTPAQAELREVQRAAELKGVLWRFDIADEGYLDHAEVHAASPA
jgi:hypothetical protein